LLCRLPPLRSSSTLPPYTTLFRSTRRNDYFGRKSALIVACERINNLDTGNRTVSDHKISYSGMSVEHCTMRDGTLGLSRNRPHAVDYGISGSMQRTDQICCINSRPPVSH